MSKECDWPYHVRICPQCGESRQVNAALHSDMECTNLRADTLDRFNCTILHWMKRCEAAEAQLAEAQQEITKITALEVATRELDSQLRASALVVKQVRALLTKLDRDASVALALDCIDSSMQPIRDELRRLLSRVPPERTP